MSDNQRAEQDILAVQNEIVSFFEQAGSLQMSDIDLQIQGMDILNKEHTFESLYVAMRSNGFDSIARMIDTVRRQIDEDRNNTSAIINKISELPNMIVEQKAVEDFI